MMPTMTAQSKNVFWLFFTGFFGLLAITVTINLSFSTPPTAAATNQAQGFQFMTKYGCLTCHKLNGIGSTVGPNLDEVGLRREVDWMKRWIKIPHSIKSNSRMPSFVYLPDEHIKIIAEYLSERRGAK
jgi:mono/diheme cytochrome c family protein